MSTAVSSPKSSAHPAVPQRRRGARFWLTVAAIVLVVLPLVGYLVAVAYVRFGGLNASATNELSDLFGAKAKVGSVTTRWLDNLQLDKVQIEPAQSGKPLTVESARLEWDAGPMLSSSRIRSLALDGPKLDLKRFDDGRWNFTLKPATSTEGGGAIEQILIKDGELSLDMFNGFPLHVSKINGAITDTGDPAPRSLSVRGELPSTEIVSIAGSLGPGPQLNMNIFGGLNIERDFAPRPPLTGRLHYDVSLRREPHAGKSETDVSPRAPLRLDGRIDLEGVRYETPALSIASGFRAAHVRTNFVSDDKAAHTELQNSSLSLEGLGAMTAASIRVDDKNILIEKGTAKFDIPALFGLLSGDSQIKTVNVTGAIEGENLTATIPRDSNGQLQIAGGASLANARVALEGLGELPPVNAHANLSWPAVLDTEFALGTVGQTQLHVQKLAAIASANSFQSLATLLASNVNIQQLNIDLGQVMQLDVIRRLITHDIRNTAAPQLSTTFDGVLTGTNITPVLSGSEGAQRIVIGGLKLRDGILRRWPFHAPVPTVMLTGDATVTLDTGSAPRLQIDGTFAEANAQPGAGLSGEVCISFAPDANGVWHRQPLRLTNVNAPWLTLNRIIDVAALTGVNAEGKVTISEAQIDTLTGAIQATVQIDAPTVLIPLPQQMQSLLVAALRIANLPRVAIILEHYPIKNVNLTPCQAVIDVKIVDGQIVATGRIQRMPVKIKAPVAGEVSVFTLPECQFTYKQPLEPDDSGEAYSLDLNVLHGAHFKVDVNHTVSNGLKAVDLLKAKGELALESGGGKTISFDVGADLHAGEIGPATISIDTLTAKDLNSLLERVIEKSDDNSIVRGSIRDLKISVQPINFSKPPAQREVNGKLSATFNDTSIRFGNWDEVSLSGPLVCIVNSADTGIGINALLTLDRYEALLADGALYIPSPPAGQKGSAKVALKLNHNSDDGSLRIRVENAEFALVNLATGSASGTIALDSSGNFAEANFDRVHATIMDLAAASRQLAERNTLTRQPWFETLNLSGRASFTGTFFCDGNGNSNIVGGIDISKGQFTFGKTIPVTIPNLAGTIPILVREGTVAADKAGKKEAAQIGEISFGAVDSALLKAEPQKLKLQATPNNLECSTALKLDTPAGPVEISNLLFKNLLSNALGPTEATFTSNLQLDLARIVRDSGLHGTETELAKLVGPPLQGTAKRSGDAWEILTTGVLTGKFYEGALRAENLGVRGLFASAPVFTANLSADPAGSKPFQELFKAAPGSAGPARVAASLTNPSKPNDFRGFEFHIEAPATAVAGAALENATIKLLHERMAARAPQIETLKIAGVVGESAFGKLESKLATAEPAILKRKEIRDLIAAENEDRQRLLTEIAFTKNIPESGMAAVVADFAAQQRKSAAPEHWIKDPKSGLWVQKKNWQP